MLGLHSRTDPAWAKTALSDEISLLRDHGHLERTADGRRYRVGFPPRPVAFDLEIEELDLRATIAAYLDYRRRRRRPRPESGG